MNVNDEFVCSECKLPYVGGKCAAGSRIMDERQKVIEECKTIIYDWARSPESEYSGADKLTREVIANQLVRLFLAPPTNEVGKSSGTQIPSPLLQSEMLD